MLKISWSAVLCGSLMAVGLTFILNLMFLSLGISLYLEEGGVTKLFFFEFLAFLLSGFVILFFCGYVSAKFIDHSYFMPNHLIINETPLEKNIAFNSKLCFGMTHGFLAWVIYMMLSIAFVSIVSPTVKADAPVLVDLIDDGERSKNVALENNEGEYNILKHGDIAQNRIAKQSFIAVKNVSTLVLITFLTGISGFLLGTCLNLKRRSNRYINHIDKTL